MTLEERFPIGCFVVMKDSQKKYHYYISDEIQVTGYHNDYLLILDRNITQQFKPNNTIHHDNVELSKSWLRDKKIDILNS